MRDQPYIPLYVQDIMTCEKLIECSAESHGVYFRLMCILHKQSTYGLICLKQKYKQTKSKYENFAIMLYRQMPFDQKVIQTALEELDDEDVINIMGDELFQERMVRDGKLSLIRKEAGQKGGSNVTKQYGKGGYLYLMSNCDKVNKIGISVNPQNRLYRLRSDHKLKNFMIMDTIEVEDMGRSEDKALEFFKDWLDGEWINRPYKEVEERFVLFKASLKAKAESKPDFENESGNSIVINEDNISELTNCFSMKENVCRLIARSLQDVDSLLSFFIIEQKAKGDLNRSLGDLRRHFTSWAKLNHEKVIKVGYKSKKYNDIPKVDAKKEYQEFLDMAKEKGIKYSYVKL